MHGLLLAGFGASAALYSLIFRHVYTPNVENYFHFCAGIVLSSHAEWYPARRGMQRVHRCISQCDL